VLVKNAFVLVKNGFVWVKNRQLQNKNRCCSINYAWKKSTEKLHFLNNSY